MLTYYIVFHKNLYYAYYLLTFILGAFYNIDTCDVASYADNNTPSTNCFTLEEVIQKPELRTKNLFRWFKDNNMKASAHKWDVVVFRDTNLFAKIGEFDTENSKEEKLSGVNINTKPSFENLMFSLFKHSCSYKSSKLSESRET